MKRAAAFCESQRLSANAWGFFAAWVSCNKYYFKKTTIAHSPDLIVPVHLGMPKNRWCSTFVYFKTPLATGDSGGFTCSASARRCSVVKCSRGLTATSHKQEASEEQVIKHWHNLAYIFCRSILLDIFRYLQREGLWSDTLLALTASLCAKTKTAIVIVPYERSPFFSLTKGRQTDKFVSQCLTIFRKWWSCFRTLNSGGRCSSPKKMIHLTTYTSFFESPHLVLISLNLYIFHNHVPANLPIGQYYVSAS